MTTCVLDASATFPWLFEDEATATSRAHLARIARDGAAVPMLWFVETANGLGMAERRGRLDAGGVSGALALLQRLPLTVDLPGPDHPARIVALMRQYRLSAYDATYLELASRLGLPLLSLDKALLAAARLGGVSAFS